MKPLASIRTSKGCPYRCNFCALWKIAVVTRACHQQGFALERYPQRGSGTRAAPRRAGSTSSASAQVTSV